MLNKKNNNNLRTYSMDLNLNSNELLLLQTLSYHAACLYNVALYNIRKAWFNESKILSYTKDTYFKIKENEHFSILLNDTSSQIGRKAHQDFNSFLGLLKLKKNDKYNENVNIPKYKKDKKKNTTFNDVIVQGRSVRFVRENKHTNTFRINVSKQFKRLYPDLNHQFYIKVPKSVTKINEIKLSPSHKGKKFTLQVVYKKDNPVKLKEDNGSYLSLDLGLNNLITCINANNGESFIIDGKKLKSINHFYNKTKAKIQNKIDTTKNERLKIQLKNKLYKLSKKRNHKINAYFHLITKTLVNYCVKHKINTVVVGENKQQKQNINIGKKNNQNFVSIPLFKLKNMLEYKLHEKGITLARQEESYTSKTSFIDLEEVQKQVKYMGKRVKRGLFKSKNNVLINADVNGAANILRKYLKCNGKLKEWIKKHFQEVLKGIVNYPQKLTFCCLQKSMASNKNSLLQV